MSRKNLYYTVTLAIAMTASAAGQTIAFNMGKFPVEVHGFGSQGFAYSNQNNYLTMPTSSGSFAFTDFGANATVQFTDRFRVGAQIYDRNIGQLGNWHPVLDWATADYRFADWFGIRAGKVKSVFGLYNDSQDMEFLHTWALLPQSMYPTDLRGSTMAHQGGDIYGTISLRKLGAFSYTAYAGTVPADPYGGYAYGAASFGVRLRSMGGSEEGGDLRWQTAVPGLLGGASYLHQSIWTAGFLPDGNYVNESGKRNNRTQFYLQYVRDRLKIDAEYRRMIRDRLAFDLNPESLHENGFDSRSAYISATYRVTKRVELGTYYSRFYQDWTDTLSSSDNHIFDAVASARVDLTPHWDLKFETHFMNGYGGGDAFRGFYTQENAQGFQPTTTLFVLRTGYQF